jgi:hypothetical protein
VEAFPFTDAEWEPVEDAALAIVNAGSAGDDVLRASLRAEMHGLLADLRERHGDHPFLLELVADYTEDDAPARVALYRQALGIAAANDLPTFTIRLALARVLLEMGEPVAALADLRAAEGSVPAREESEQREWADLVEECEAAEAEPNAAADGGA